MLARSLSAMEAFSIVWRGEDMLKPVLGRQKLPWNTQRPVSRNNLEIFSFNTDFLSTAITLCAHPEYATHTLVPFSCTLAEMLRRPQAKSGGI